jgi:cytochrome oxidase assembly protein ShyY1
MSPRARAWAPLAVGLAVAVVCVRLGVWQLDRLDQRHAFERAVARGLEAPPLPLERVLLPGTLPDDVRYRPVVVTGSFDAAREVILYGRPLDGRPGNHVLTPLVTGPGRAVIVDRGWVPFEIDEAPVAQATPPVGEVRVTGLLMAAEADGDGDATARTLARVDLALLDRSLPYDLEPMYVLLAEQDPPQGALPRPARLVVEEAPPHLAYAIQWFAFASIAVVGSAVLARRRRASLTEGAGPR